MTDAASRLGGRRTRAERLEARVTAEQKNLIERAAALQGRCVTDFVLTSVQDAARRAIEHMISCRSRFVTAKHSSMRCSTRSRSMIVFAIRYAAIASEPAFDACLPEKTRSSTWSRWLLAMTDRDSRAPWRCSTDIFGHSPVRTRERTWPRPSFWRCPTGRSRATTRFRRPPCNSPSCRSSPCGSCRNIRACRRRSWAGSRSIGGYKGRDTGRFLLADALYRSARSEIASFALIVDAKDDSARRFYERESFLPFPEQPMKLFRAMADVKRLFA